MSSNANERREERAANVVTAFKKIMDMLNDETKEFKDNKKTILTNIGSLKATISFSLVEIAGDALPLAVDSPYYALIDRVSDMIIIYYYAQDSSRVGDQDREEAVANIIMNMRKAFHYVGKDQRREEQNERKKFRATGLKLAGDTQKVSKVLSRDVARKIAKEEGESEDEDEDEDASDDEDDF